MSTQKLVSQLPDFLCPINRPAMVVCALHKCAPIGHNVCTVMWTLHYCGHARPSCDMILVSRMCVCVCVCVSICM